MAEPSSPWFQVAHPRPAARRRLFCLAHAGGGAALFRGWGERLPGSVEVVAVQPPGREGRFREPPFTDWRPLVAELADAIRPLLDKPFALFGHSLGALLAYELARRLRDLGGKQPDHLFAAALAAPHLPNRREPTHTYADADFRESLRRRGGTPPAVLGHAE